MAQIVQPQPQMMILPAANPAAKDSRWLTLEVCREFQRAKCSRTDQECKFAHPLPHVEVQNGRVVACFDSIKGKCQRKDPPCKYLHPPQHLREQLLQNGRNNLILKNLQLQAYQQAQLTGVMPVAYETGTKVLPPTVVPGQYSYLSPYHHQPLPTLQTMQAPSYSHYLATSMPSGLQTSDPSPIMSQAIPQAMIPQPAKLRADKFETTSQNGEPIMTSHVPTMEALNYQTYIQQATSGPAMQHPLLLAPAKKRPRDPQEELLLQSTMPGLAPAYKRIAMGDISKGGFPVYQTNHMMPQLQHASLMQFQQPQSYIPTMSFAGHPPSVPRF